MNYWIWLSTVKDLGPIKKLKLLDKFKTPYEIFKAKEAELLTVEGISPKLIENINASKDIELLKKYEAYILQHNISIININDKLYPQKLREIYAPPITLFAKGNVELLNNVGIAIVGCRVPSEYGKVVTQNFSVGLSKNGFTIISGMASGIDSIAHDSALMCGGKTIAVLGCGVDIIYPNENRVLYSKIIKNGLVLSEYVVGTWPKPEYFPQRNRIISGLSSGVLVVEAKKKSGTMITTDFALEQGKELYVVPGNITSKTSEGTNNLIKEGAKVVTCIDDIIEDYV